MLRQSERQRHNVGLKLSITTLIIRGGIQVYFFKTSLHWPVHGHLRNCSVLLKLSYPALFLLAVQHVLYFEC